MRRVLLTRLGGPDGLTVVDEPAPTPKPGEVRLRTLAAGVAYGDVLADYGATPGRPPPPYTPGYDVVGTVDALGAGVTGWTPGQRAAALVITGGYAEQVCVAADRLVPIPDAVRAVDAAAVVLNYTTAYQLLHRAARVTRGQTVLVHGAAGGVGTALLQLAALAGVRAFGTASAGKLALVHALGATPIDYRAEDFVRRVRDEAGGADAAFDGFGGGHLLRSRRALRRGGVVVLYGVAHTLKHGRRDRAYLAKTLAALALAALVPGTRAAAYAITDEANRRSDAVRADLTAVLGHLAAGEITPVIGRTFPLADARESHRALEGAAVTGKIVLTAV